MTDKSKGKAVYDKYVLDCDVVSETSNHHLLIGDEPSLDHAKVVRQIHQEKNSTFLKS